MEQYPDIKGTADFLVSPIMQTGTKEGIKRGPEQKICSHLMKD